ncbi:Polygalacturonase [Arachidicoccus rhizosphaerae]|uniref:Polygalacturonase n=1 Tax=Arachidicoccus rhizosphaerae TaxID=551991 RepID=A0A1H4ART2_9BACT|nr:glycosyl hydrolase family 28 protein [Arachidicoccus rhizosphaerae]SEA38579.1 Polygalacturonase [Arachidicoccus rhizosphaerae]
MIKILQFGYKCLRVVFVGGLALLLSSGCKRNDSLFPVVASNGIHTLKSTGVDTTDSSSIADIKVPSFETDWGKSVKTPAIPSGSLSIMEYGADTLKSDNSVAIQAAIDAAGKNGGGTVQIPKGNFRCGPIRLVSNVGLHFEKNAQLTVLSYADYPGSGTANSVEPFIDLSNTTNVLIDGAGTINGQGADWWAAYRATKATAAIARPPMIAFDKASIIEIAGITIKNAPNGHISIHKENTNITISDVTIDSPEDSPNTDGIDVWTPYVNIYDCTISCGDDNIAMNNNTKYVTISGCAFGAGHGLSIGSYTANIDHIYVNNCSFNGTDNGIHIKSSRERSGEVGYLVYENLTMEKVKYPVNICEYYPDNTIPSTASSDPGAAITATTPVWKNIVLKNILVNSADYAGMVWAVPELPLKNIIFDSVRINANAGMKFNNIDSAAFIHGSSISVSSGAAFTSTYHSNISGINLLTGAQE